MRGIYSYEPETHPVPVLQPVCSLQLQFTVHAALFLTVNVPHFHTTALPTVCVQFPVWQFCTSFTSCFAGMLLKNFLNDFKMVPVAPIITGITFVFYIPHALFYCNILHFRIHLDLQYIYIPTRYTVLQH